MESNNLSFLQVLLPHVSLYQSRTSQPSSRAGSSNSRSSSSEECSPERSPRQLHSRSRSEAEVMSSHESYCFRDLASLQPANTLFDPQYSALPSPLSASQSNSGASFSPITSPFQLTQSPNFHVQCNPLALPSRNSLLSNNQAPRVYFPTSPSSFVPTYSTNPNNIPPQHHFQSTALSHLSSIASSSFSFSTSSSGSLSSQILDPKILESACRCGWTEIVSWLLKHPLIDPSLNASAALLWATRR